MRNNKEGSGTEKNRRWKIYGALGIMLLIIIFFLSSQEGDISRSLSRRIAADIAFFLETVLGVLPGIDIEEIDFFKVVNRHIRQTAHFLEYFLLSVFICQMVWHKARLWQEKAAVKKIRKLLFAFGLVILIAALDEIHQVFIPGRTSQAADFLINAAGVSTGFSFVLFVHFIGGLYVFKKKTDR